MDASDVILTKAGGMTISEVGGGYQLRTKSENQVFVRRLTKGRPFRLSGPSMALLRTPPSRLPKYYFISRSIFMSSVLSSLIHMQPNNPFIRVFLRGILGTMTKMRNICGTY